METSSRTLKFRIWNKTYKEMFYPTGPTKNGEYEEKIYLQLDGVLMGDFKFTGLVDCSEDFIIQQFTGLKDSKGVDVYEGDIIVYESAKDIKTVVRWTDEEHDNHPGFIIVDQWGQYGEFEVIGNVFENENN